MRYFWATVSVFLICILFSSAQAQRGIRVVPKDTMPIDTGERWAVIIGINRYQDPGIGDLDYAVADAMAFQQTLVSVPNGFPSTNVLLMTDEATNPNHIPTRSNLIAQLTTWLQLAGADDTALIYLAGHGIEKDGRSYLLPHDAKMTNLGLTAIELEYLKESLQQSNARNKVLIVDACHSGAGRDTQLMGNSMALTLSKASEGMVMLASCDLSQRSYEMPDKGHGAFTYFLMEALKGAADMDSDGVLLTSEVNRYVWDRTRRWAATNGFNQTPKYVSAVSGDIILAHSEQVKRSSSQISVTPGETTSESDAPIFSLQDLVNNADLNKRQITEMQEAYAQVVAVENREDMETAAKVEAWKRFLKAFAEDLSHTDEDDLMRSTAEESKSPKSQGYLAIISMNKKGEKDDTMDKWNFRLGDQPKIQTPGKGENSKPKNGFMGVMFSGIPEGTYNLEIQRLSWGIGMSERIDIEISPFRVLVLRIDARRMGEVIDVSVIGSYTISAWEEEYDTEFYRNEILPMDISDMW